ncbi:MAG: RNase adapter RapZ [Acidobacteriota bacterium]|nr:RNase adapter RapZ [Acidobacteriota bacterium]
MTASNARKRSAARSDRAKQSRFVVVTGLSGSGKSQAIRALEDLGYFCVDNLPVALIPTFADLVLRTGSEITRAAVVIDVREGRFLEDFPTIYRALVTRPGLEPRLIFLEADDAALVRRFSETRRPHPLAPDRSVSEGITEERALLKPIRRMADEIVDTSSLNVHDLRQVFMALMRGDQRAAPLAVTVMSFGFKHGVPVDIDMLLDVRFLPNPHFVPELRERTGREKAVADYVFQAPAAQEFLDRTLPLLRFLLPHYAAEGKTYLTIGIGCTGGRHRSVAIAEALAKGLGKTKGAKIRVRHRDSETR